VFKYWTILLIWAFATVAWFLYPYRFVGDDPLFYFVVARNIALHGQQTFSGIYLTNGVHPLWQYLVAGYTCLCVWINPAIIGPSHINYAVPLSSAVALFGGLSLARFAELAKLPRFLVADIPLIVLMSLGVVYSEAHLCYAMLGWLAVATLARPLDSPRRAATLGMIAALVFLARLDTVFFVAVYGLWYMARTRRLSCWLCFTAAAGVFVVPYLVSNQIFFGSAMPISGWIKSSFPHLYLRGLENPMSGQRWSLSLSLFGCSIAFGLAPACVAGLAWLYARRIPSEVRGLIGVFWAGATLQLLYIALFTRTETWWYNYYALPIVTGGLGAGLAVAQWKLRHGWESGAAPAWQRRLATLLAPAVIVLFIAVTVHKRFHPGGLPKFQEALESYLAENKVSARTILMADYPGHVAWATDNYVVSADMLTGNRRLYEAMKTSPQPVQYLLDYCAQRGHPVDFVVCGGKSFMQRGADQKTIIVNDPKQHPRCVPLGEIHAPFPYESPHPGLLIWRLSTAATNPL
jgi:hypothetical protein